MFTKATNVAQQNQPPIAPFRIIDPLPALGRGDTPKNKNLRQLNLPPDQMQMQ